MKQLVPAIILSVLMSCGVLSVAAADVGVSVSFSADEISIITGWYREHGSMDKGKRGKGRGHGLPPGIAKNLARGKALPPGIAKQYLPDGLLQRLPAAPDGYERIVVGGKILMVEIATRVIHDVLMDVVLN